MSVALTRDLHALAAQPFDVLVVGGGVYGLTVACDAAQRGLRVALVERSDFGSGTSFNHLRTIHGGLRYLQTLDLARARESVRERRTLARVAPWAVTATPFVLPLHRSLMKGPMAMRAGFALDAIVARDRNDGVSGAHRMPPGRVISRNEAQRSFPELQGSTFVAAAVWYDYLAVDADRLTLSWGLAAVERGACLANYVSAETLTAAEGRVTGAEAVDRSTGERFLITAGTVVNATGSHINRLLGPLHADAHVPLLQAVNLVTTLPAPSAALGGRSRSGRNLFAVPWQGRALFGTWESARQCAPDDLSVSDADISAFIDELNEAFPWCRLTRDAVSLVHRGVVPARVGTDGSLALEGRELVFDHRAQGLAGCISVAGTKYTTARSVAERIVDQLYASLDRPRQPSVSATMRLPHTDLSGDALLRHAAQSEMVVTLADAVMRRTTLGALGLPTPDVLQHAAHIVGEVLGWSEERQRVEMDDVVQSYRT